MTGTRKRKRKCKVKKRTKQRAFLPGKYATEQHVNLGAEGRSILHDLMRILHHAIYIGRRDLAKPLACTAAELCAKGGRDDID